MVSRDSVDSNGPSDDGRMTLTRICESSRGIRALLVSRISAELTVCESDVCNFEQPGASRLRHR
jgi:hypothetical protein